MFIREKYGYTPGYINTRVSNPKQFLENNCMEFCNKYSPQAKGYRYNKCLEKCASFIANKYLNR